MFNLTNLTNFDLTQLDPTRLDLTRLDLTRLDLRNIDLPTIEVPNFDRDQLPSFDFPTFEMPAEATRLAVLARDAAHAGVGVVVTTVKKADEHRRELTDQVNTQVRKLVDTTF